MDPRSRLCAVAALIASTMLAAACGSNDDEPGGVVARASVTRAQGDQGPGEVSVRGTDSALLVDVAGLVRRPGVYRLPVGARVHEAISAAGGARSGADLTSLNRAAPVVDGQQVLVPARSGGAGAQSGPAAAAGNAAISINAADAAALDALPGIGPVTAAKIIEERTASGPFASVDDLDRVPGIGPGTIESLREHART